ADLLLSKGDTEEADRLFRRVLRGAPDEELVARAARLSMQINLGKGTLESLEQELLPLAIGNPQKAIYRRLLVEIYGNLTFALVPRYEALLLPKPGARGGDGEGGAHGGGGAAIDEGMPTDVVAVAAVWGIARMQDKRAAPLLRAVLKRGTPEMRAFAVIGLGL